MELRIFQMFTYITETHKSVAARYQNKDDQKILELVFAQTEHILNPPDHLTQAWV